MQSPLPALTLVSARSSRPSLAIGAAALLALAITAPDAFAQANVNPPTKLTYQGFLTSVSGVPLGNTSPENKTVVFRIYDAATGGSIKWASRQTVTFDKGYFSVLLGEGDADPANPTLFNEGNLTAVFTDGDSVANRHLEIVVDGTSIAPRLQFLTSPYAFLARRAKEVDASAVTTGVLATDRIPSLDTAKITSGALATDRIPSLDAGKITTGTLSVDRIPSLNANKINAGTLDDARLSANVAKLASAQTFTAINTFNESIRINGSKVINFGYDVPNREVSAGQIGYGTHSGGSTAANASLDIVGAGTTGSRKISLWAEGGITLAGGINASGNSSANTYRATSALYTGTAGGEEAKIYRDADTIFVGGNSLWHDQSAANYHWATYNGDNNWDFASDKRLKRNIVDAEPMLESLLKVRFRRFNWKTQPEGGKAEFGVVAQELEPIFPDLVDEVKFPDQEEKMKTVGYTSFGTIAAKAIQELKAQTDKEFSRLHAEIEALKVENKELRTKVQARADAGDAANDLAALRKEMESLRATVAELRPLRASR